MGHDAAVGVSSSISEIVSNLKVASKAVVSDVGLGNIVVVVSFDGWVSSFMEGSIQHSL